MKTPGASSRTEWIESYWRAREIGKDAAVDAFIEAIGAVEAIRLAADGWDVWANPAQLPPESDWRVWLFMGGRGAGKTRAGAEWVRARIAAGKARRRMHSGTMGSGAPKGNQNALKHGFYAREFPELCKAVNALIRSARRAIEILEED